MYRLRVGVRRCFWWCVRQVGEGDEADILEY